MGSDHQPELDEIEACLAALVDGRMSRDAADRWAVTRRVAAAFTELAHTI
ncbi:MAG TPA: hypothetical protein VFX60_10135 [Micromonospora sp.]|nr:hypothetical protein [Micromonospora sp.]